ncbi:hypothetical protein [Burkholderia lata]|uniref:hypothetical protein n=1 Tax=Burkholderia lata (strain ATCC 17760 / DSM 23089 / LMG 22485 / NCIMB 9086 / R18194 / 383) TaxID=482957 RepID=UPI0014540910|nr:hypothetical protein [Burkholderia lata]VWB15799.1 hypothetical protein BLA15816_00571 [Burkholderia lata]
MDSLSPKLGYHDIGVVSRQQPKLRFVVEDNFVAWHEPDFSEIKSAMIGNQIHHARSRRVVHRRALALSVAMRARRRG